MAEDTQAKFAELRTAIKNEDYDLALVLSTEMIKLLPDDEDVLKCKCISLIHLGRFDEALQEANIPSLEFEKAYCLYQVSRLPESLKIIRNSLKLNDDNANMKCLEAQVLYKLSEFSDAADVYQQLIHKDYKELEGSEVLSNALAAYAQSGQVGKGRGVEGIHKLTETSSLMGLVDIHDTDYHDPDKSYELAYNTACAYINNGKYQEAFKLLELSQRRLKEQLLMEEKDHSDATNGGGATGSTGSSHIMTEEEASISTQLAYVLLKLNAGGSVGAAKAMMYCVKVLKSIEQGNNDRSSVAKAVCINNLAVIRRDKELSDSLKRLENAAKGVESKLTPEQYFSIKFNYCLVLLQMNNLESCRKELESMQQEFPTQPKIPILLVCLDLKMNHQGQFLGTNEEIMSVCSSLDNITDKLSNDFNKEHVFYTEIILAKVQLLLQITDYEKAASALSNCSDTVLYKPGTLATLVDLYERFLSNPTKANDLLDQALGYYQNKESSKPFTNHSQEEEQAKNKRHVLMAVAGRKLMNGDFEAAADLYQQLLSSQAVTTVLEFDSETRLNLTAHLILAKSWNEPEQAEELALQLPKYQETDEVEVEDAVQLEDSCNLPRNNRARRLVVVDRAVARAERKELDKEQPSTSTALKRHEKRRTQHIAKLTAEGKYDPTRPSFPDPERWVAKKLRSYNRRKGKRGAQQKYSGAQGTSSEASQKDAAKLDAYARAQAKKEADARAEEPQEGQKRTPYRRLK